MSQKLAKSNDEIMALPRALRSLGKKLASIHIPMVLVQGDNDELVDLNNVACAKEKLINAQFREVVLPNFGHLLSIGWLDLGGMTKEWSQMLFNTMTGILLKLDDRTVVLPGHYMDWTEADEHLVFAATMGQVKARNAAIYTIADADAFYDFIRANMRPQPEEYAEIRKINAGLVEVDAEQQEIMDIGKNECAASLHAP